jgi:biopolymer transport protein ExbD
VAGGQQETDEPITGINVTPLVDIVLVLLIIFMVTAKLIVSKSVPLDLPKAATGSEIQTVFSVVLANDGTTQVDSRTVPSDDAILGLAKGAHDRNPELRAVIKADAAVPYGRVVRALDLLKQAQVAKIAFAVQPTAAGVPGVPGAPSGGGAIPSPPPQK